MKPQDEIEAFLDELKAEPQAALADFESLEEVMRNLYRGHSDSTIELCDAVCTVIRDKSVGLDERLRKLVPILVAAAEKFAG